MKKSWILYFLLAAIVVLAVVKIIRDTRRDTAQPVPATAREVPVDVYIARDTSAVFHLEEIGTLLAYEAVDIVSEISRRLITSPLESQNTRRQL